MVNLYQNNINIYLKVMLKVYYEQKLLAIKTKACNTSIRLYRLPPTFNLSLRLKMLIKANYNQQMYSTSHSTIYCVKFWE